MQRAAADRALSGYPYFRAHPAYTAAVAAYMQARFGVTLDPVAKTIAGTATITYTNNSPDTLDVLFPRLYA